MRKTVLIASAIAAVAAGALASTTAVYAQAGSSTPGNSGIRDRDAWRQPGWDNPNSPRAWHQGYRVAPGYYSGQPAYGYDDDSEFDVVVQPRVRYAPRYGYHNRWEEEQRFRRSARTDKQGGDE